MIHTHICLLRLLPLPVQVILVPVAACGLLQVLLLPVLGIVIQYVTLVIIVRYSTRTMASKYSTLIVRSYYSQRLKNVIFWAVYGPKRPKRAYMVDGASNIRS